MPNIKERYINDPIFHAVVDQMRALISSAHLAPSEVREAAMLACILEQEYRPIAPLTTSDEEMLRLSRQLGRDRAATFAQDSLRAIADATGIQYQDLIREPKPGPD